MAAARNIDVVKCTIPILNLTLTIRAVRFAFIIMYASVAMPLYHSPLFYSGLPTMSARVSDYKKNTERINRMKISELTLPAQFRKYALQLSDAPLGYEYGKETPIGADCSGIISYALLRMGYKIRATAQDFFNSIFIQDATAGVREYWQRNIIALFFHSRRAWYKVDVGWQPPGSVVHVAPLVGENVVLHADVEKDAIYTINVRALIDKYDYWGNDFQWRAIDMDALAQMNGVLISGVDPEYWDIQSLVDRGILDE